MALQPKSYDGVPQLFSKAVPLWPRLAWVARLPTERNRLLVWHGPDVEVSDRFFVEGVWPEEYYFGRFDQAENFFGSGACFDGHNWVFVTSCSTVDRLWKFQRSDGALFVANSLPALMALAQAELDPDYSAYRQDMHAVVRGWREGTRSVPAKNGVLKVFYFVNLVWNGVELESIPKPTSSVLWHCFQDYRDYLFCTAKGILRNARANQRKSPLDSLTTISRGYDSPAASVIAQFAGATQAFTIDQARSLLPRSDSGAAIAEQLGYLCKTYTPESGAYCDEEWFIAALGWSMDMNLSIFDYPNVPTMLFTGFHGDKVWARGHESDPREIVRGDPSGTGFCEFRLLRGVINIPVPFFGIQHAGILPSIATSSDMQAWRIGGQYDRPIPRRIIEEAGVERSAFGQHKSATTIDDIYYWPQTKAARARFESWLRKGGKRPPLSRKFRLLHHLERLVETKLPKLKRRYGRLSDQNISASDLMFYWSNNLLASSLRDALVDSNNAGAVSD